MLKLSIGTQALCRSKGRHHLWQATRGRLLSTAAEVLRPTGSHPGALLEWQEDVVEGGCGFLANMGINSLPERRHGWDSGVVTMAPRHQP